ncbi:AMP-binding protein [Arthrobacter sp. Sa2BUA2]|uniref:AMP-binding protein n=1 Tax=Arthrobacter pullicola TaxID=2762224 RepID=A0ABR8YJS2_9MICC|nr:AMP-binding protein [Arthrobacter pullicola]MBD8044488.1 AMP-binding protein [Arthrobacter pullicola]
MELLPVHTPAGYNAGDLLAPLAAALAGEGPAVAPHADPAQTFSGDLPNDDIALVISTSGSTGTPKQTMLSIDALAASSMATALSLKKDGQWLLALPVHYIAGVQVLIRSLFAGTEPVLLDTAKPFDPGAFTTAALEMTDKTRLTSLVPTQLHRLLAEPAADTLKVLRRFDAILLGGAAAGPALLAEARGLGLNVVTTYGMSETAGGCVYDGVPLPGADIQEYQGRLWIAGDMLADGYLGAPELTADRFAFHSGKRWFRTDDTGSVAADGTVSVSGRLDDVIVTGGVKVSGAAVAAAAEQLPEVHRAVAVGLPDAEWGSVVGLAVVGPVNLERLRGTIRAALGAPAAPKTVVVLERIPLLPNGKTDRLAVRSLLSAARS